MSPRPGRPGRAAAGGLALLGLLAACSATQPVLPPVSQDAPSGGAALCRIGPDGGPPTAEPSRTADRGIGGTGAPSVPVQTADRGIGGTGAPPGTARADTRLADRGIGGTGIVAVITGFASVCLAGQEVALDVDVPVDIGGRPATASELRAGQVALMDADGAANGSVGAGLRARRVTVRYEVTGPVQASEGEMLRVAGQPVAVPGALAGEGAGPYGIRPSVGDWVAVSGLRRPDGVVEATRIDRVAAGEVVVHGRLEGSPGALHIGALPVRAVPGIPVPVGRDVVAVGRMEGGALRAEQLAPDLLATDPAALFGIGVGALLVETFAVLDGERVRFGQGFTAGYAAPSGLVGNGPRRAVLALEHAGDGGLRATGLRSSGGPGAGFGVGSVPGAPRQAGGPVGGPAVGPARPGPSGAAPRAGSGPATGAAPASRFEPAPMPDRALRAPDGAGTRAGDGAGGRTGRRGGEPARPGEREGRGRGGDGADGRDGMGAGPGGPFGGAAPGGMGVRGRGR